MQKVIHRPRFRFRGESSAWVSEVALPFSFFQIGPAHRLLEAPDFFDSAHRIVAVPSLSLVDVYRHPWSFFDHNANLQFHVLWLSAVRCVGSLAYGSCDDIESGCCAQSRCCKSSIIYVLCCIPCLDTFQTVRSGGRLRLLFFQLPHLELAGGIRLASLSLRIAPSPAWIVNTDGRAGPCRPTIDNL